MDLALELREFLLERTIFPIGFTNVIVQDVNSWRLGDSEKSRRLAKFTDRRCSVDLAVIQLESCLEKYLLPRRKKNIQL